VNDYNSTNEHQHKVKLTGKRVLHNNLYIHIRYSIKEFEADPKKTMTSTGILYTEYVSAVLLSIALYKQ